MRRDRPGNSVKHLDCIRKLPSCVSGRRPCDAHHLRVSAERGVGMKATDRWTVPLTRDEHEDLHRFGSRREVEWFARHGIPEPFALAQALWRCTGDEPAMRRAIGRFRAI
jgi:hypothetical protein